MLPWMPHFALWSSPLNNELYVGLCRALAGPWLGGARSYRATAEVSPAKPAAAQSQWRVLDRDAEGRRIGARSLAELRLVRDGREAVRDGAGPEVAPSSGGEIRQNPAGGPAG
jgi:hypothetical protein